MPGEEWTTRLKVDVSEFKKGISDASKAIKEANATFKAETSGLDRWAKDADGLQKKLNSLKTVLANQKTILQAYQGQLSKTEEAYEENGRRAEMLKAKLQELAQNGVAKTDAEYQRYESALKDVLKEQDNNAKSCEDLRMKILGQQAAIGQTERDIRHYTAAQQEMEREAKSIISTVDKQEQELADLKKEYVDVSTAQGKNSDAARDLAKEIERLSKELKENKDKMNAAEKEADQLDHSLEEVDDSAGKLSQGFTVMRGALASLIADGIRMAASKLKEFASDVIETGMAFEASMAKVAALSGAAGESLDLLTRTAREYGATTQFSASEAADALGYMALAGWDAEKSAAELGGVLNLAAAAGIDLAQASDMVTDYLSAFSNSAMSATEFADKLAYAQANSNTSAEQLGEAYKNSAAKMNAAGQSVDTTTALLASMANQGLKGSEAGTALAAVMRDLTAKMQNGAITINGTTIAVQDANGNYRDLIDVLREAEAATVGLGTAEKATALAAVFTDKSQKGLNLILNEGIEKAAAFSVSLQGASVTLNGLRASASAAGIDIDEMQKAFEEAGVSADDFEKALQQSSGSAEEFTANLTKLTRSSSKTESIMKKAGATSKKLQAAMDNAGGAAEEMARIMNDNLQGDVKALNSAMDELKLTIYDTAKGPMRQLVQTASKELLPALTDMVKGVEGSGKRVGAAFGKMLSTAITSLVDALPSIAEMGITIVSSLASGIISALPKMVLSVDKLIGALVKGIVDGLDNIASSIAETFFGIENKSKAASEAILAQNEAIKSYAETLAQTEPVLADYNQLLSDQGNTISELDTKISETEQAITGILSAALREQRELRESDLESIRTYMDEMNRLQEEKLSIYRSQQLAELTKLKLESGEITQATAAQHLANTQKALDEANKATDDAYTARLTAIEQKYQAMNQIGSEAYQTELEAAKTAHDAQIAENKRYSTEALEILSQNSNAWVQQDAEKWAKLSEGMQAFNTSSASGFRNFLINAGDFFNGFNSSKDGYLEALKQMDKQSAQGLLNMATQVATSGGQIDEETKKLASNILGAFDNLPAGLDAAGKDALLGMITGLEAYIPELSSASEMSANEIVDTIKEKLGIASPSTVLAAIGENTTAGLVQGMESKQGEVAKVAQSMASAVEKAFTESSSIMMKVGGNIGVNIAKGLQNNIAKIKTAITTIINQVKNLFAANQVSFQQIGTNIVSAIAERMSAGQGRIQNAVRTIIGDINQIFASNRGRFQQIGTSISNAIADNFTRGKSRMQNAASGGANAMVAAMRTSIRSFEDVGTQMARGVWTGFQRQESSLTSNVRAVMRRLVTAVRKEMDERSPSKVFAKIGAFMAEGLGIGFVREMKATNRAILQSVSPKAMAGGMLNGLQSGMAVGTRIVNNNSTQSFVQNIYAPKQPSRIELYRQTKKLLAMAKGV